MYWYVMSMIRVCLKMGNSLSLVFIIQKNNNCNNGNNGNMMNDKWMDGGTPASFHHPRFQGSFAEHHF